MGAKKEDKLDKHGRVVRRTSLNPLVDARLKMRTKKENRSISNQIAVAVEYYLNNTECDYKNKK